VPTLAGRRVNVAEPARNLSGLCRVRDKADLNRLHLASAPQRPLASPEQAADRCTRAAAKRDTPS